MVFKRACALPPTPALPTPGVKGQSPSFYMAQTRNALHCPCLACGSRARSWACWSLWALCKPGHSMVPGLLTGFLLPTPLLCVILLCLLRNPSGMGNIELLGMPCPSTWKWGSGVYIWAVSAQVSIRNGFQWDEEEDEGLCAQLWHCLLHLQNPRDFTFKQAWHYSSIHSYKLLLLTIILQTAKQEIFSVRDIKHVILIQPLVLSNDVGWYSFKCYSKQLGLQQEETILIFHVKELTSQSFKIKDVCKKIMIKKTR